MRFHIFLLNADGSETRQVGADTVEECLAALEVLRGKFPEANFVWR